jgi:phage gp36-like protein
MSYTDPATVLNALSPTGTPPPGTAIGALSQTVFSDAISDAEDEINARLATRYQVPFPDDLCPDVVQKLTRDIAAYWCLLAANGQQEVLATHPVQLRFNRAQLVLLAISSGEIELPPVLSNGTNLTSEDDPGGVVVVNTVPGRLFGLRDFGISVDPFGRGRVGSGEGDLY